MLGRTTVGRWTAHLGGDWANLGAAERLGLSFASVAFRFHLKAGVIVASSLVLAASNQTDKADGSSSTSTNTAALSPTTTAVSTTTTTTAVAPVAGDQASAEAAIKEGYDEAGAFDDDPLATQLDGADDGNRTRAFSSGSSSLR